MNKDNERIIEVSKNFVVTILSRNMNIESANDLYEINGGNKEVLLEHLKAINSITNDAIKILEGDK